MKLVIENEKANNAPEAVPVNMAGGGGEVSANRSPVSRVMTVADVVADPMLTDSECVAEKKK